MTKFLKRIGCLKINFDFEILLSSIEIPGTPSVSGFLRIYIKKRRRQAETQKPIQINSASKLTYPINETLMFPMTLFLNKKSNKYLEKPVLLIVEITKNSSKVLQAETKLDFSLFTYSQERSLSVEFEKVSMTLNLSVKIITSRELGISERDSDCSFLSSVSKSQDPSPYDRSINSYAVKKTEVADASSAKQKRHHPSAFLEKPLALGILKTPTFILEEEAQLVSASAELNSGKHASSSNAINTPQIEETKQFAEAENKEKPEKRNIKGIKVHISKAEMNRILKKNCNPQDEDLKYKEKQELLDKILELEKCLERKNQLLEEKLRQIKDLHKAEEDLKLTFYGHNKESINRIKALTLEIESLKTRNSQISENLVEKERDLQTFKEVLMLKDQDIKKLVQGASELQEENKRLMDLNRDLTEGKKEQHEFFKDFQAFNVKIKLLYEENQGLRERIDCLEGELAAMTSQKEFLFKHYEKTKEELDLKERKRKDQDEVINFLTTNNNKNEEAILELKKELKQKVFEREEALSQQTALIIELQNLKFKMLRKNMDQSDSNHLQLSSVQEENAFLRKETQLLQKKLELLTQTMTEEKEENSQASRSWALEKEKLRAELDVSERRRLELETELIQISRSSKVFLISDEFESLKRTFDGKVRHFQEKSETSELKIKEILDENERLRVELADKTLEMKRLQIQKDDLANDQEIMEKKEDSSLTIEVLREKDQIILNCHEKIKDLISETDSLRMKMEELRRGKEDKESKEIELENEIGGLLVENEKFVRMVKERERDREKIGEELKAMKEKLEELNEERRSLEEKIRFLERERGSKEEKISFILMKAIEIGGSELVDKLTQ